LSTALLQAAERILERDGIQGLTLRATARRVGVSHAAPKNHFDDLPGLLSELAAEGFRRCTAAMLSEVRDDDPPSRRMDAIGKGYVAFARASWPVSADVSQRAIGSHPSGAAPSRADRRAGSIGPGRWRARGKDRAGLDAVTGRRDRRGMVAGARLCDAAARRPPGGNYGPAAGRHHARHVAWKHPAFGPPPRPGIGEGELFREWQNEALDRLARNTRTKRIPTGINALDEITGGLHRKQIAFLAARTSVGKTTLGESAAGARLVRQKLPLV